MSNEKASIVCFEQFIEAFLTESSKSPASIAKSNKRGTYLILVKKRSGILSAPFHNTFIFYLHISQPV